MEALLLDQLNYHNEYTFAFDDIKLLKVIKRRLDLFRDIDFKGRLRFFVFVSPLHTTIEGDLFRLKFLRERGILPYVMRHHSCWESDDKYFYTDIAGYCNVPTAFKRVSLEDFLFNQTSGPRRKSNLPSLRRSVDMWSPETEWPKERIGNSMNKTKKLKNVKLLKSQNFWGEISDYPVSDWQDEVRDGNTRSGYWNWVVAQIEAEDL